MTKKILIRVDGSKKIGLGHVYNMLTILHHLRNEEIIIVMHKKNNLGSSKFKKRMYKIKFFQNDSELFKIISSFKPDIIFNDILNTKTSYMKKIRKLTSMIVNFEDVGAGRAHADLVFNPIFNEKKALTKEFYGGEFACVRDEFRMWTSNVLRKNVKKILVSFGGTDPTQITIKIFKVIENLSLKNITKGIDNLQWIYIKRQKTNIPSNIPILPPAFSILKKYRKKLLERIQNLEKNKLLS